MTYAEAIQFLYGLQMFGANFGLERAEKLAALAGHPEKNLRFIHVAGTNGKGSTCAMLESIYRHAGLRVGLFTSPHLVSFRERIQINRQLIHEEDLTRIVAELAATKLPGVTLFEFATVLALKHFAEQKCDLVIWETGMGGRLDATNIVTPLASVITNIGFDHMEWLGDTLAKIAFEKAGIIKPGVPVLTSETNPEPLAVIKNVAQAKNAPLTRIQNTGSGIQNSVGLLGEHQQQNAALAVATVNVLQKQIPVSNCQMESGLKNVHWPGRLQLIERGHQRILLDGAHNIAGAETLRAALAANFSGQKPVLIFGALADKKWPDICRLLAPLATKIFTVPVASSRTADARELAAASSAANPSPIVTACENLSAALNASRQEPFVVITGSLYLIGEALGQLGHSPANEAERGLNDWKGSDKTAATLSKPRL